MFFIFGYLILYDVWRIKGRDRKLLAEGINISLIIFCQNLEPHWNLFRTQVPDSRREFVEYKNTTINLPL